MDKEAKSEWIEETCPKCEGRKILHLERMQLPQFAAGFGAEPVSLPLAVRPVAHDRMAEAQAQLQNWEACAESVALAIQNLPVRFAMDRAGLVGADGATHAGSFDLAYLCTLPNFVRWLKGEFVPGGSL